MSQVCRGNTDLYSRYKGIADYRNQLPLLIVGGGEMLSLESVVLVVALGVLCLGVV